MKKGKAITLFTIISLITAFMLVMTFIRFPGAGIENYNSVIGAIEYDYDVAGGTAYTLTLDVDNNDNEVENINQVIDTVCYRLEALGYTTYQVKAIKSTDPAVKDYDIRIEARPRVDENNILLESQLQSDINIVAAYGQLKFFGGESANPTNEILTDISVIESASYVGKYEDGTHGISITLTPTASQALNNLMAEYEDYFLSIKLEDKELLSGSNPIGDAFQNRTFYLSTPTEADARQAILQISSGGLAYKYIVSKIGMSVVSPYGANVLTGSLIAIIVLLVAFMIAYIILFKGYGAIISWALLIFALLQTLMLVAVPGIKLSLGGIIGMIIAILIAGDGFIVVANKIKDEFAKGKTIKSSIKTAYSTCLKSIIGAGLFAGIVGLVSFIFLTGTLKCFGITLGIGAVLAVGVNLLIARLLTAITLPLIKNKEKFLNLKREDI